MCIRDSDATETPLITPLHSGQWRIQSRIPIEDFNEAMGSALPDDDWDTLGGLLLDGLGRVPAVGDRHREAGFEFVIEQVEGRRIVSVLAEFVSPPKPTSLEPGLLSNG